MNCWGTSPGCSDVSHGFSLKCNVLIIACHFFPHHTVSPQLSLSPFQLCTLPKKEVTRFVVSQVDVEVLDPRGRTPLQLAVTLNHLECARVLLHYGADVSKENSNGWTGSMATLQTLSVLTNNMVFSVIVFFNWLYILHSLISELHSTPFFCNVGFFGIYLHFYST